MDCKTAFLIALFVSLHQCDAIKVNPCPTNKIAPRDGPQGKTFGFLFGPGSPLGAISNDGPLCGPLTNPNDDPSLVTVDNDPSQQNGDYYDPVNNHEEPEPNNRPYIPQRPSRPNRPSSNSGLFSWWPNIITEDHWPVKPPRPPPLPPPPQFNNDWFWGWFGGSGDSYKPPKPTRPPFYEDATKPVHEYIEGDEENVTWKPGLVVGGPNNNIIGVMQDLSNWSSRPTPRPTRPSIPGYNRRVPDNRDSPGIIGSFIDLLFKK